MMSRQEFFSKARNEAKDAYTVEGLYHAYEVYRMCPAAYASGVTILLGKEASCRRCGECCKRMWRIEASAVDVKRWIDEGRDDILRSLKYSPRRGPSLRAWSPSASLEAFPEGDVVMPKGAHGCAYHYVEEGSTCAIYETRPEVCVNFPRQTGTRR